MPNFKIRSYEAELIDDLALSNEALAQNLQELALTNLLLGGNQVTISGLKKLLKGHTGNVVLADLGCGGGDMLMTTARWFRKNQALKAQLIGLDANAFMVKYAQERSGDFKELSYEQSDVFSEEFTKKTFDIATLTLFCHHFNDQQLINLFASLKQQTRIGLVINDLHRHPLAYYAIMLISKILGASYLYQNDSKLSVLRAFSKAELVTILQKAGFKHFKVSWAWAFRWQVVAYC